MLKWLSGIICLALLLVWKVPGGLSADLSCEILQIRFNRVYLACGQESYVFAGQRFVIVDKTDTVGTGVIEQSLFGVSYSSPLDSLAAAGLNLSASVIVETPEIDSSSAIQIGSFDIDPVTLLVDGSLLPDGSLSTESWISLPVDRGNMTAIYSSSKTADLITGQMGYYEFDGAFSEDSLPGIIKDGIIVHSPAPYFAVLIPNLASPANVDGILSTSIYYRYRPGLLAYVGNAGSYTGVTCLFDPDTGYVRPYPYDPQRGRLLLDTYGTKPSSVVVSYSCEGLKKFAGYIADVLSRDRVEVVVGKDDPDADLILTFIPVGRDDPVASMEYILGLLDSMEPRTSSQSEALTIIKSNLELARQAYSVEKKEYFCQLADRSLKHDLGVFPLFRPSLYFTHSRYLTNCRFDSWGYLDFRALTKLQKSAADPEDSR